MIKDNLDTIRAMKYENSREYEPAEEGEDNHRDYEDCAYKIYTLMKAELEKNKSTDWRGMLTELENHLTRKKEVRMRWQGK